MRARRKIDVTVVVLAGFFILFLWAIKTSAQEPMVELAVGDTLAVDVMADMVDVHSMEVYIHYDSTFLDLIDISTAGVFDLELPVEITDPSEGKMVSLSLIENGANKSGTFTIGDGSWKAISSGSGALIFHQRTKSYKSVGVPVDSLELVDQSLEVSETPVESMTRLYFIIRGGK